MIAKNASLRDAVAMLGISSVAILVIFKNGLDYPGNDSVHTNLALTLVALALVFGGASVSRLVYRSIDVFSPWLCFPAFLFLMFGLGAWRWIIEKHAGAGTLTVYYLTGFIAYLVGTLYPFRWLRCQAHGSICWSRRRTSEAIIVLLSLSVIGAGLFVARAGVPILHNDLLERKDVFQVGGNSVLFVARLSAVAYLLALTQFLSIQRQSVKGIGFERTLVYVTFFTALMIMGSTGSRNDIFFMLFTAIVIKRYYSNYRLTWKTFAYALALLLAVLGIGFYRLSISQPEQLAYLSDVANRMSAGNHIVAPFLGYIILQFSVYSGNVLTILDVVPKYFDYLYGANFFITLGTILPGSQDTVGSALKEVAGLDFKGGGMNPTIIGELYVDFGWPYVVAMMFLYGRLYRTLYDRMQAIQSASNILLYSFATFCLVLSVTGGLFSQLNRWYYLAVFLVVITYARKRGTVIKLAAT